LGRQSLVGKFSGKWFKSQTKRAYSDPIRFEHGVKKAVTSYQSIASQHQDSPGNSVVGFEEVEMAGFSELF
jgi:hypothetical protein